MVNTRLMQSVTVEKLIEMGFNEEHDDTGDPRGTDWNMRSTNFHIWIDAWFEVKLRRVNPDTDHITVQVDDLADLQSLIDFIAD